MRFSMAKISENLMLPKSCRVGSDMNQLANPRKAKAKAKTPESLDQPRGADDNFTQLAGDLVSANAKFYRGAPIILLVAPIVAYQELDAKVREYVKVWGKLTDKSQEHELYEIPNSQLVEIHRRISMYRSVAEGVLDLAPMFLVALVASYETFFGNLIRVILLARPEIISSSDRNLSFRDLVEVGSIESARERIIEREIDEVMRSSLSDQHGWIEQKLVLKIKDGNVLWPGLVEMLERRNLITHTDGVVSSQYLQAAKKFGFEAADVKLGDRLDVQGAYLREKIDLVLEFGIKLIQVVWRKILPLQLDSAVGDLNHVAYELIVDRRFKLAANLLKFGLDEMKKHGTEAARKQMVVNYANAVKMGGDKEAAVKILDKEDWTATNDKYRICVHSVRDEVSDAVKLMKSVADAGLIDASEFRQWPVFETMRAESSFAAEFEKVFGEKLLGESDSVGTEAVDIEPVATGM